MRGHCKQQHTARHKNKVNLEPGQVPRVSEIKLIRTDTTLDLSQKAMKRCLKIVRPAIKYRAIFRNYGLTNLRKLTFN